MCANSLICTKLNVIFIGTNHRFRTLVGADGGGDGSLVPAVADTRFRAVGSEIFHPVLHEAIHAARTEGLQVADDRFDESVVPGDQNQPNRVGRRGNYHGVDRATEPQHQRNEQGRGERQGKKRPSQTRVYIEYLIYFVACGVWRVFSVPSSSCFQLYSTYEWT